MTDPLAGPASASSRGKSQTGRFMVLLNLAVLVVNFVLVVAHSDTQERVLRATTRMACDSPAPPWLRARAFADLSRREASGRRGALDARRVADAGGRTGAQGGAQHSLGGAIGQVPHARLLKYLARVEGLDALSSPQLDAVYGALEHTCRALLQASERVRRRKHGGAGARRSAEQARERIEQDVANRLRQAQIQDDQLLARLVRVVVSSAG